MKIDDELEGIRWLGRPPRLADSELICLAVAQALLGFHSEARWLRFARAQLAGMFSYLPKRPGYNKRLRAALPSPGLLLIADKGFASRQFEADPATRAITLLRPAFKRDRPRAGEPLLKSVRQLIESINHPVTDRFRSLTTSELLV